MIKNWIDLNNINQINKIIEISETKTQIIFKDSVTCGISAQAKDELVTNWKMTTDQADFYYLDLLQNRDVSNAVAEILELRHQSPQLIVLNNKIITYTVTHHKINYQKLIENLK